MSLADKGVAAVGKGHVFYLARAASDAFRCEILGPRFADASGMAPLSMELKGSVKHSS